MSLFKHLERLLRIHDLIEDPTLASTQPEIARILGVSERTIRSDLKVLRILGAPLVTRGRFGWRYGSDWDLRAVLKTKIDKTLIPPPDPD